MSDFVVSPPGEWRKRAILQVTLPNGLNVELRRPNMQALVLNAKKGDVPHGLRNQIILQLQGGNPDRIPEWKPGEREEELPELDNFMRTVVKAAFVNPVIADEPDENARDPYQIAYGWLDDESIMAVFSLVMSGPGAMTVEEEADGAARFPDGA
jgi:hypothetical protein